MALQNAKHRRKYSEQSIHILIRISQASLRREKKKKNTHTRTFMYIYILKTRTHLTRNLSHAIHT